MTRTILAKISVTIPFAAFSICASLAQELNSTDFVGATDELSTPDAPDIIFSNFGPGSDTGYEFDEWFIVAGKSAADSSENWIAMAFVPKADALAKVLVVPISYISGTKKVNLGIYSTNEFTGSVGTVLSGGQGSTSEMPNLGDCCQLTRVKLPDSGVMLTAGVNYWLVASPDDVNAATFEGAWKTSNFGLSGYRYSGGGWTNYPSFWVAAQIRGTKVGTLGATKVDHREVVSTRSNVSTSDVTIFTNLGTTLLNSRYNPYSSHYVTGPSAPDFAENWLALPFTPRADTHAKSLAAAIGYIKGTKKVNLGIYSDSGGSVGTLLPGGQGSTTDIPTSGDCCQLTKVNLPGEGAALAAGTQYWLVASTDDVNAPDFEGAWADANAFSAYQAPEDFINWTDLSGLWLAAEIRGTSP